jgi:hypothetical protein
MPQAVNLIRIFLASPADVSEERVIVQKVVGELNRSIARSIGVFIDLIRWEDFLPGMGRPEQIILDQANIEETDLFIGILWNRFGTPTGVANCGTEEEFDSAYQAWKVNGKPHIVLYFCSQAQTLDSQDSIQQRSQVLAFRARVAALGLIREFQLRTDFENLLRRDITNYILSSATEFDQQVRHNNPPSTSRILEEPPSASQRYPNEGGRKMIRISEGVFRKGELTCGPWLLWQSSACVASPGGNTYCAISGRLRTVTCAASTSRKRSGEFPCLVM